MSIESLEDYEFLIPSLDAITDEGHAFSIPWDGRVRAIMAGFDSTHMKDASRGPWTMATPFELSGTKLNVIIPEIDGGTVSFRDGFSTKSEASTEHLSAAVGITVGYPFLNASVSGKYDKTVVENKNGVKASRNATCRAGRIVLVETPTLTARALNLLNSSKGRVQFKAEYGDYYVAGYELGADAGACMSASTESASTSESLEITVRVKVLWKTVSKTHREATASSTASSSFTFCGFNTLDQKNDSLTSNNSWEQAQLQSRAAEYLAKVGTLDVDVRTTMSQLGLIDGQTLPLAKCSGICESGLVVQLLLAPFARLNEYVMRVHEGR